MPRGAAAGRTGEAPEGGKGREGGKEREGERQKPERARAQPPRSRSPSAADGQCPRGRRCSPGLGSPRLPHAPYRAQQACCSPAAQAQRRRRAGALLTPCTCLCGRASGPAAGGRRGKRRGRRRASTPWPPDTVRTLILRNTPVPQIPMIETAKHVAPPPLHPAF